MRRRLSVYIQPASCIILAALFLIFPLQWVCAWILAVLIHEAGHCAAVFALGGRITAVSVSLSGIKLHTTVLAGLKAVVSSMAGPVAGILLLLCAKRFPRLALCGLFQSAYNLLPIYPLDGGWILQNCLNGVSSRTQFLVENVVAGATVIAVIVITFVYSLGLLPLCMVAILVYQYLKNKNYLQRLTGQGTIGLLK